MRSTRECYRHIYKAMALANAYAVATGRIPDLFAKIRDGQAPALFTQQLLKDWGFQSSNDRALIPLLKAIGFLSPDGKPTTLYTEYRDHSRSKKVMARALRESYGDIFLIKEHPTPADKESIQGKFKSYHNVSDLVAGLMTKTFLALLALADLSPDAAVQTTLPDQSKDRDQHGERDEDHAHDSRKGKLHAPGLHYNIQIHLPSTKDVEVYNSIFKSLKEHLFEN
jgi:hypothetical protein